MMLGEAIFPRGPREGLRFAACVVRLRREAGWILHVLKEPAELMQHVLPSQVCATTVLSHSQLLQSELSS